MSVSMEQMYGPPPDSSGGKPPADKPTKTDTHISMEAMYGPKQPTQTEKVASSVKSAASNTGSFLKNATNSWADVYWAHLDSAVGSVKQAGHDILDGARETASQDESKLTGPSNVRGMVHTAEGLGEGLLGLMNVVWEATGVPAAVDQLAKNVSEPVVNKVGKLVNSRPEEIQDVNDLLGTLYQLGASVMPIGQAAKISQVMTPETKAILQARQAAASTKAEAAFEEAAHTAPEATEAIIEKTAEASPSLAKKMRAKAKNLPPPQETASKSAKADIVLAPEKTGENAQKALAKVERKRDQKGRFMPNLEEQPTAAPAEVPQPVEGPLPTKRSGPVPEKDVHSLQAQLNMQFASGQITREQWSERMKAVSRLKSKEEPVAAKAANEPVAEKKAPVEAEAPEDRVYKGKYISRKASGKYVVNGVQNFESLDKAKAWIDRQEGKAKKLSPDEVKARLLEDRKKKAAEQAEIDDYLKRAPEPKTKVKGKDDDELTYFHLGLDPREAVRWLMAEEKLGQYWDFFVRHFSPESLGEKARKAGAIIASGISRVAQRDAKFIYNAAARKEFWDRASPEVRNSFINDFEAGRTKWENPHLQEIADYYRNWTREMVEQDRAAGVRTYEAKDHYFPHIWKRPDRVSAWLDGRYGKGWATSSFAKKRQFNLYDEAIKAGFKPKYDNIEDVFLARQHASDIAQMKIEILDGMEANGAAFKGKKSPGHGYYHSQPGPNGETYWMTSDAYQVFHNAFKTQSLWEMAGPAGNAFRGAMFLKNALIPIELGFSLFHPLHVIGIDNATGMKRAMVGMLSGRVNPVRAFKDLVLSGLFWDTLKESYATLPGRDIKGSGNQVLRALKGDTKAINNVTARAMQTISDGGFTPFMDSRFKTNAMEKFGKAIRQRAAVKGVFQAPFALLHAISKPIFEDWIPSLKISSYLKDCKLAMEMNPGLAADTMARQMEFRRIAKSVDNRYGEMQYNTLFWNRMVKDIAVANTLSLGWQLGFIREYGGGMLDAGEAITDIAAGKGIAEVAKSGKLDRPLFVLAYTTQALAYGGLLTYAMTGELPKSYLDYFAPRTGEKNPDGTDKRVTTMFYTREFLAVGKRAEIEGWGSAAADWVTSKGSGLIGLALEGLKGVNAWGEETRSHDDDTPLYLKTAQQLDSYFHELQPISKQALQGQPPGLDWTTARAVAGFTPAPKYITGSKSTSMVDSIYKTYYAKKQTPYDRVVLGKEKDELTRLYNADDPKYEQKLDELQEKYNLTNKEIEGVEKHVRGEISAELTKFKNFDEAQQKKILDQIYLEGDEEKFDKFLRSAHKKLKYSYETPAAGH